MDLTVSQSQKYSVGNLIEMDKNTNFELYKEVYKIAEYFKEELNYDRVPFCPMGLIEEQYKAILFTEQALDKYIKEPTPYRIYGACLFTIQTFTQESDRYVLKWIWFHPFFRNRGNLRKNWDSLENKFGNFIIETPISNDMKMFLKHVNSKYEHIEI